MIQSFTASKKIIKKVNFFDNFPQKRTYFDSFLEIYLSFFQQLFYFSVFYQ